MRTILTLFLFCLLTSASNAQVNYTANEVVPPYSGTFRPGLNFGVFPPWTDEQLADIAAGNETLGVPGVGARAIRPALYGHFVEEYGYDFRLAAYEHFAEVGLKDNTLIVGFPSDEQRDPNRYCPGVQSELFANLYADIWDGGANGTPVNDENYYALYIYKLASLYGQHIKFWEIWNEPGFDYTGALGWLPPGTPENWWDNNPNPCDFKLRAPIFHYVRLLRISYEVIKTLYPESYIVVSGVGYPSFLDAILRNTDNPFGGTVSADYPEKGGAYFDVMGFHSYPHFDGSLKVWDDSINGFRYSRHSDAAANGLINTQQIYREVLEKYGYDGQTHPKKLWIMTEGNIPRKVFGDFVGGAEVQRNYVMKAVFNCIQNDILQLHLYKIGEDEKYDDALGEFELMGLYQKLTTTVPYYANVNDEGIAYKTVSDLLFGKHYDVQRTADMALPAGIKGGAFRDADGRYTYALWAETTVDRSEVVAADYTFPANLNIPSLIRYEWDYSRSRQQTLIQSSTLGLTASPIFLTEAIMSIDAGDGCAPLTVSFQDDSGINAARRAWSFEGGIPASASASQQNVAFSEAGTYEITLELFDASNNLILRQAKDLKLSAAPSPDFSEYVSGPLVVFTNNSGNYTGSFLWDFGDGATSTEPNPTHVYFNSGSYTVRLDATNECGTTSITKVLNVSAGTSSRLNYTANDTMITYDGVFRPGVNMGVYDQWEDEELANIAAGNILENVKGIGVKAVRPLLTDKFFEQWGYDIRTETFQHYTNLDLEDNTVIIGFPSDDHRDPNFYCATDQSELFANMYLDIWDNGENGTPVNDDNYYAVFLYETVRRYKDHVRFWEIWNEPSFDYSGLYGWLPPGQRGNWWENNPNPCDYKLRAPIFHLVRMLRISYEVIHQQDPDAYVTLSGVAFPSFLDAVLRNTDNPQDGSVAPGYELKGGAYFDVMGFHNYPHFDGSTSSYDVNLNRFVYDRHSDAAVGGIVTLKDTFQTVLAGYGYDDITYPEKQWIITESNVPRKAFGEFMGSDVAQRNYILKAVVQCMRNDILQLHVYKIGEEQTYDDAFMEFNLMGLYQKLDGRGPYSQVVNNSGIAYKTASDLLFGAEYDAARTAALALPNEVDGAAFKHSNGAYTYVLWAKTKNDQSEDVSATYSFPATLNIDQLYRKLWNYSQTEIRASISSVDIPLTGAPVFLSELAVALQPPVAAFSTDRIFGCAPLTVQYTDHSVHADSWSWTFPGGTPATSSAQHPEVVYNQPGMYSAILEVSNAAGTHAATYNSHIEVEGLPSSDFTVSVNGSWANFEVTAGYNDSISYYWIFDDGFEFPAYNPNHFYFFNGQYTVQMIATNSCGSDTTTRQIVIAAAPQAIFINQIATSCAPYTVKFFDQSTATPNYYEWYFPGGTPENSTQRNPVITYNAAGVYTVRLIVDNGVGRDTTIEVLVLENEIPYNLVDTLCLDESIIVNGVNYNASRPSGTETIVGGSINGCDSVVNVQLSFYPEAVNDYNLGLCEMESIIINGTVYGAGGVYSGTEVIPNASSNGCDSIINVQAYLNPYYTTELAVNLCPEDLYNGVLYTNDTLLVENLFAVTGCDSFIHTMITVNEDVLISIVDTIPMGETYPFNNQTLDQSGTYFDTLLTSAGCDSIIQLSLTVDGTVGIAGEPEEYFDLYGTPNPFKEGIDLYFELPQSAEVNLEIFDLRGRRIAHLIKDRKLPAGKQQHYLEGENLPAGLYLCRLHAGSYQTVIKLMKM